MTRISKNETKETVIIPYSFQNAKNWEIYNNIASCFICISYELLVFKKEHKWAYNSGKKERRKTLGNEKDEISQPFRILLKEEPVICDEYGTCTVFTFRINYEFIRCGRNVARKGETRKA